ncbi:MAG: flagellar biosynthesis protein FlgE [Deltaproteobacteria bacterium]|jgi:flagellar hook protein FlgE|nr:flagellar biosynthesis protein FlgE [Deltaproteobacteria bacterium]
MSLSNALFSSVTGLETSSTAISVIGENIANVNTPGFKQRRVEFSDILGQALGTGGSFSQTGSGARVARIIRVDGQGSFESSERATDMAIEGQGFFMLDDPIGGRRYTRAGLFGFDNQGYLVDKEGLNVQGFTIDPLTGTSTGQVTDIRLIPGIAAPQVSSLVDMSLNLDADPTSAPPTAPFAPATAQATSNFQQSVTLFDSLGAPHSATIFFSKTATANTWNWNAALDPSDTTTPPAAPADPYVVIGGGNLTFDTSGNLTGLTGNPVIFNFSGGAAAGQAVTFNFGPVAGVGTGEPTTQFAEQSAVNSITQDGFAPGALQAITIDTDGVMVGSFSNGETRNLSQLALAQFPNVEGMASTGNNNLLETRASGQPLVGNPRSGQFGAIRANNFEQSNVDLADQFVRLIINQRAFQANTRTVSVTNELMANVVQLGQ